MAMWHHGMPKSPGPVLSRPGPIWKRARSTPGALGNHVSLEFSDQFRIHATIAKEIKMYTNPYVAQKYAEMKIKEAQRWAEVQRMLGEAQQPQQEGSPTWRVVAATAIFGIVGMLSGLVDRLTAGGRLYR